MPSARDLNMLPHKISVIHKLSDYDKEMWFQSAAWAEGRDKFLFPNMVSRWGLFYGGRAVIKQNMHYWKMELPAKTHKRSSNCLGCHVQARSNRANVFFNETVNSEQYLHMLWNDFLPQLTANGLPLQAHVVYARWCHIAWCKHHAGLLVFGPRVMSNHCLDCQNCSNSWPPLSPALNPGDFNLWYSLNEKLFPQKPSNKCEIREMLVEPYTEIEEDLCRRVITDRCHWLQVTWNNVATQSTRWHNKTYADVCAKCMKGVADKQHIYFL